jgi:hypothetical protein
MEEGRQRRAEEAPVRREEQVGLPELTRPVPDDDRAKNAGRYIGVGLLSFVAIAAVFAVLFLAPAFAAGFILRARGLGGRLFGVGLLGAWIVLIALVGRRVMRPPDDP